MENIFFGIDSYIHIEQETLTNRWLMRPFAAHLEHDLHMILLTRSRWIRIIIRRWQCNKIIILTRSELQSARLWRERTKCDRKVTI